MLIHEYFIVCFWINHTLLRLFFYLTSQRTSTVKYKYTFIYSYNVPLCLLTSDKKNSEKITEEQYCIKEKEKEKEKQEREIDN